MRKILIVTLVVSILSMCCACQKNDDIKPTTVEVTTETVTEIATEGITEKENQTIINVETTEDNAEQPNPTTETETSHEHTHEPGVGTEIVTVREIETETTSVELRTSDHVVITAVDEGHEEGDFNGTLAIKVEGETEETSGTLTIETYYADIAGDGVKAQEIVDAVNSAAYFRYDNYHVYAAHNNTTFVALKFVDIGSEAALFDKDKNMIAKYVCVRICEGYNYGHIFDENMTDLSDLTDGTILMYTCNLQNNSIHMTFWDVVE